MMMMRMMMRPGGMSCRKALKLMQSYLDGEVEEKLALKVAKHLNACKDCDEESLVYKKIKASLANRPPHVSQDIIDSLTDFTQNLSKS